jgi:hypothetical protein
MSRKRDVTVMKSAQYQRSVASLAIFYDRKVSDDDQYR